MKKILILMSMMTLVVGFAAAQDDCCKEEAKAKVEVKQDDCCATAAKPKKKSAEASCCSAGKKMSAEDAFMAEARRMMIAAEGKEECCKSTPAKPTAKGEGDCCNAEGAPAKFKVFVAGQGYKFFGCEGSAGKGRTELLAKGLTVGKVQKVTSKVMI